jgi:hypothetical protein
MLQPLSNDVTMDDLKIRFDGDSHQIDANTLINSLLHFTNITQEVNRELATDRKIEIKVNALKEGSFLVHIILQSTLIDAIGNLFSKENLEIAGNIVAVVGGIYGAAKFLKGAEPKVLESNDQSVKIENNSGDVTYIDNRVFNIYQNNKAVRESISQEFETLNNDSNVTGFEILDKNDNTIVQIQKEEFQAISNVEDNRVLPDERVISKVGTLFIYSLSFDNNAKWSFYYEGNKFSAKINDDEFARLIDSGEKFAKGDTLDAEFEIKQEFYQPANTYVNKSYKIIRILKHNPRTEQGKLDFPTKNV